MLIMSMLRAHLNVTSSLSSDYCKGIFLQNASASTSISFDKLHVEFT